ncbi:MAG TPA: glucose-6-phosphate isomerase [Dongiaceae bacterium]|nr:glucose-6-phosphate isomerase [Dongiaceae bacterium]
MSTADLTRSAEWAALKRHRQSLAKTRIAELFTDDPQRFAKFSLQLDELAFDFSKNLATAETLKLLHDLARVADVAGWRDRMFAGERINSTEDRAVYHVALRHQGPGPMMADGKDVMPDVRRVQAQMRRFATGVREGHWRGATGERIKTVVNIGIGGSDLGPAMAVQALRPFCHPEIAFHFVSNVDGAHLQAALAHADPGSTLFIVSSKTFTTQETLANANAARGWLTARLLPDSVPKHFVAVSAATDKASAFGIAPENVFGFWDWVGGRYSMWSAIGLPVALALGWEGFERLLAGAHAMDQHFRTAPAERNIPLTMSLIALWNIDFLGANSYAVLPYAQDLARLPAYLQQLEMESNGKSRRRDGKPVKCETGPVLFGEPGTNGQHAFYQLIHQGTQRVFCDFILAARERSGNPDQHRLVAANFLAQSQALMFGRTPQEAVAEMRQAKLKAAKARALAPHRSFGGDRPSNSILIGELDPYHLGKLIALYEHKTFVLGILWGINSFDQWGVELGKQLANDILSGGGIARDGSTAGLKALYDAWQR